MKLLFYSWIGAFIALAITGYAQVVHAIEVAWGYIFPAPTVTPELFREVTLAEVARADPSPIRAFGERLLARSDLSLSTHPAGLRLAL